MDFKERFENLNTNQQSAVEKIYGPLLVIAGPGTGKTELLSMRAAQILRETDTLPGNILCLTFTESGAANMRERLRQIVGEDAYKAAISTFHSFGVEIINQNREYFFQGGDFKPADELAQFQILQHLFENLAWDHLLAKKNGEDFIYLKDVRSMISEFKTSGLSGDDLRLVINDNQRIIEQIADDITAVFSDRISKKTIEPFAELAKKVSELSVNKLPSSIPSYANTLALSIAHASQEAIEIDKTGPITAWKKQWCKNDTNKKTVLIDSLYIDKMLATIDIYDQYELAMKEAKLYDYDDMILNVIRAVESNKDLQANLQEQYQFIMVDEFQDTNLAQLRLLFSLTDGPDSNVMAVGDDDQAIFSFQGADIGNIQRFRERFEDLSIVVLKDNYRSSSDILSASRDVITQGEDRLENSIQDLSKELTPHFFADNTKVSMLEYPSVDRELSDITKRIRELIDSGAAPETIAVIARWHHELVDLLPFLYKESISVNYERRDNALDHEVVKLLELMIRTISAINDGEHDLANQYLPELVAHPAFGFSAKDIWKLSLGAWRNRTQWIEEMQAQASFVEFSDWLIQLSQVAMNTSLEQFIDILIGNQESELEFKSPVHDYFFSSERLKSQPDAYLGSLEALRTIRDQLREHFTIEAPKINDFIAFIDLYRQLNIGLTTVRHRADLQSGSINLMTAHKSKGLEFDHVFILNAIDTTWGEGFRGRSRNIRYPANLKLQPVGDSYDERLRLFFVAMTRAKTTLTISYPSSGFNGKPTLIASFLSSKTPESSEGVENIETLVEDLETDWRRRLVDPITTDLKTLLAPALENYKLSATHLNNFIDVSRGGPQKFLLNNLLRFPQGKSPAAGYGTAIHDTLQFTHNRMKIDGKMPDTKEIIETFIKELADKFLSEEDFEKYSQKGQQSLATFLSQKGSTFTQNQSTELSFGNQGVVVGDARLTGALDLVDIDKTNKTIVVTDYKTGKPSPDWKGKTDYEKISLHRYRQQLMFYQLLVENSRDYSQYSFESGILQFVEPDNNTGEILSLDARFSRDDLAEFSKLISIVWKCILNLDLPPTDQYGDKYKDVIQFEQDLLDRH